MGSPAPASASPAAAEARQRVSVPEWQERGGDSEDSSGPRLHKRPGASRSPEDQPNGPTLHGRPRGTQTKVLAKQRVLGRISPLTLENSLGIPTSVMTNQRVLGRICPLQLEHSQPARVLTVAGGGGHANGPRLQSRPTITQTAGDVTVARRPRKRPEGFGFARGPRTRARDTTREGRRGCCMPVRSGGPGPGPRVSDASASAKCVFVNGAAGRKNCRYSSVAQRVVTAELHLPRGQRRVPALSGSSDGG